MKIEIAGWESFGLRCPDIKVDLRRDGQVPRVALVQMPNGTGKTTTLELLHATLSGSARDWPASRVCSYRRSHDDRLQGQFKVTLLVDGKLLSIELVLSYATGRAKYHTTNPGSGGVVPQWHVPPSMNRFLTPEFLSLFIFDGEFAGRLLDGGKAEADRVVDALCQIYLLNEVSAFAQDYWEQSAKTDTTKTESGLDRLVKSRDRLMAREKDVLKEFHDVNAELTDLGNAIWELQQKVEDRVNNVEETRRLHDEAKADRRAAEASVASKRGELMVALRLPHEIHPKLSVRLTDLRDNLDRLRLPENTSAQFFEELLEEEECICGRPMDEGAVGTITTRAQQYLDADDAGVINAMKKDIEHYTREQGDNETDVGYTRILRLREELTQALREEKLAEQKARVLMGRLIDAGDEELRDWQRQIEENSERYEECKALLKLIEGAPSTNENLEATKSLRAIGRAIKALNERIAQIRGTVRLRNQTELISELLNDAGSCARDRIKRELLEECNRRLSVILENDPLVIESIDRSIHLRGQEGASAGQSLAIGYTFLMSVLERGQNDFPLVVDSPAGPIDKGVRRRIGRLLPTLCSQFVGFTINTEREGFVDSLERTVDDIRFLTLFRKTPGTTRMMEGLPLDRYDETDSAVLVDDKRYFFEFDIEDEEEEDDAIQAS